jgi:hypothetical protein
MKFARLLMLVVCLVPAASLQVWAQGRSEIAVSLGAGSLQVKPGGGTTPVFSVSYQFHITGQFAAEGALDLFYYKFDAGPVMGIYKDDYLGAEAAVLYYFRTGRETRLWLPFVVAGIGKTSTDFTEIAAHPYYHLGAGVAYHLTDRLGIRLEARDEIIKSLAVYGGPNGNLPSIRCGIVFRF